MAENCSALVSFMLTVTYAECHIKAPYAECRSAKCRGGFPEWIELRPVDVAAAGTGSRSEKRDPPSPEVATLLSSFCLPGTNVIKLFTDVILQVFVIS